jgi:hypothetical protein
MLLMYIQLKHHSTVSQYGQLSGSLKLGGEAMREHFKDILYNQAWFFIFPCRGPSDLVGAGIEWQVLQGFQPNRG